MANRMTKTCPNPKCTFNHNKPVVLGKFCVTCGARLVEMPKCRYCKAELWPSSAFCPDCGRPNK